MKWIGRLIEILLLLGALAVVAFMAVLWLKPELLPEGLIQENEVIETADEGEIAPEAELTVDYPCPYEMFCSLPEVAEYGEDIFIGLHGGEEDTTAFAVFKDTSGDCYYPWDDGECEIEGGMFCDANGIVGKFSADEVSVVKNGEVLLLRESAYQNVEAGSYYLFLKMDQGAQYNSYYTEIYDTTDFTPDTPLLIEQGNNYNTNFFYQDTPEDIVLYLANLGENTIVGVQHTDSMDFMSSEQMLSSELYEISENGSAVTLKAEGLALQTTEREYYYTLIRKDGSTISLDKAEYCSITCLSSHDVALASLSAPDNLSISSGEDLVITCEMGDGETFYSSNYWFEEEGDPYYGELPVTELDMKSGEAIIPHETLEYFYETYGYFGMNVSIAMNANWYVYPGVYVELTE